MTGDARHERASAAVWRWRPAEEPSTAGRARRRGLVRGLVGLAVSAVIALWQPTVATVAAALALALVAAALASPSTLYPRIERLLAAFGHGVAVLVTWIALAAAYVLAFVPLGLLLRSTRKLRLVRTLDPEAPTYWRPPDSGRAGSHAHERQF